MAVKKTNVAAEADETAAAATETVNEETASAKSPEEENLTFIKTSAVGPTELGFCVYLGPTIHGVIQSGMICSGTRADAEKFLASAIEKYPLIAKLVVTDKTLAEDRVKVKTAGNALNVFYRKLASGKSV